MTTYHIGLRDHFDLFSTIRAQYVTAPYPAWTAVEVAKPTPDRGGGRGPHNCQH